MKVPRPAQALPKGREQLVRVITAAGDVVHIADVSRSLDISRAEAAKRLSRWTEQGWLRRVGRGAYVPVSLDALGGQRVLNDPWVLVPALYSPAYVGGRTAAEHWDLTEQIFKDIVVITNQLIREKRQERHGSSFTLKHLRKEKIFGTKPIWREHTKVLISDVHRTVVDILDDPALGGGIQHVSECVDAYLARSDRDDDRLVEYAERLGNGAVFKRLGFLVRKHPKAGGLPSLCESRMTTGIAKLDPALECPRVVAKWRIRVPRTWADGGNVDRST